MEWKVDVVSRDLRARQAGLQQEACCWMRVEMGGLGVVGARGASRLGEGPY